MKKIIMFLLVSAVAVSAFAQETNDINKRRGEGRGPGWKGPERPERTEWTPAQREEYEQRKVQLMDKVLNNIGVGDEDKIRISRLQEEHRSKMKANSERTFAAREKLSRLQNSGSTAAQLDAAIDQVTQAQSEQLKILVRNRMEMEQILGKEKYARFMESARMQFRQHEGHRGTDGLPPRPRLPPVPNQGDGKPQPPLPRE